MSQVESIEEFYRQKFNWLPENFHQQIGHFNLFRLEPPVEGRAIVPYRRRNFYKIMLVKGNSLVHYADRVMEVKKQALTFSNPQIPYKWEHLDNHREGCYCIFNQYFFHHFGDLNQYSVFQPNGEHVFELTDEQVSQVQSIYDRMFEEIGSDYVHKYDVLRNLVFELLHFALKMHPGAKLEKQAVNAAQRISTLFMELLERQFPIEESHPQVSLRSPAGFAKQLNVHVNHLNRAVRETTDKTTSQIIAERILQEAKILLKHSQWNVSEIGFALGFVEVTHFNNFFKKYMGTSPLKFRKGVE